jgi:DNA uptake protein ComE-like DNA-binding protein
MSAVAKLDLDSVTEEELVRLAGMDPASAHDFVEFRETHGLRHWGDVGVPAAVDEVMLQRLEALFTLHGEEPPPVDHTPAPFY